MGITEAMDRLNAKNFKHKPPREIVIFANRTDVDEGIEPVWVEGGKCIHDVTGDEKQDLVTYQVCVDHVDGFLRQRGLPSCKVPSPELQAIMDDIKDKESKIELLRRAADAATFAIEQSKGDANCDVTNELLIHWHDQEHTYLVALGELEAARANLKKLS